MRRLVLLFLFTLPCFGAITLGNHTSACGTANVVTTSTGINTAGATALVVADVNYVLSGNLTTVTDSADGTFTDASNVWVAATTATSANVTRTQQWYSAGANLTHLSSGATHKFRISHTGGFPSIAVAAVNGSLSAPLDGSGTGAFTASGTTLSPFATYSTGDILFTPVGFATAAGTTTILPVDYTIIETVIFSSGNCFGLRFAWAMPSGSGTSTATWSWVTATDAAAVIASFKPAPVGGAPFRHKVSSQ